MLPLPATLAHRLPPVLVQFSAFAVVGVIGLGADTAVLYALLYGAGIGFYLARSISFLLAATVTWALNRRYTFRHSRPEPLLRQWARFLATNAFGGGINYGVYAALIAWGAHLAPSATANPFSAHPFLAVAAGSIAGMFFNFIGSRWLVFGSPAPLRKGRKCAKPQSAG